MSRTDAGRIAGVSSVVVLVLVSAARAQQPEPAVPELRPLAALAGQWDGEFVVGKDPGSKATTQSNSEWTLDGWLLVSHVTSKFETGGTVQSMMVWGYNPEKKLYTRSIYFTGGTSFHETGTYIESTRTFNFAASDPQTGGTHISTLTFTDDDTRSWKMISKPNAVAETTEIVGTHRRKR